MHPQNLGDTLTSMEQLLGLLPERLGFKIVSADAELVHARLEAQPELHHQFGALHGGVLFSVADSAAAVLVFHGGQAVVGTTDAGIRFLAPVETGAVDAFARVRHAKGRSVSVEVELRDEKGELVALYNAHFVRVPRSNE